MTTVENDESRALIESWLVAWMEKELGVEPAKMDRNQPFLAYAMNSVQAMILVGELEDHLSMRLRPTLVWDYPNAASLTNYLVEQIEGGHGRLHPASRLSAESSLGSSTATAAVAIPPGMPPDLDIDQLSEAEVDALLAKFLK